MSLTDNEDRSIGTTPGDQDEPVDSWISFVLCRDKEPGSLSHAEQVVQSLLGPDYEAEVVTEDGQVCVNKNGDLVGVFQHVPAPVPGDEAEANAVGNILWPQGPTEVADHQSHVIVVVFRGQELSPIEAALTLTRLTLVALELFNGFAVYWGLAPVTNPRGVFEAFAKDADEGLLPVPIWLRYSLERNDDGSWNLYTWGMRRFGLMDLEFEGFRLDIMDLLELAWSTAQYLLQEGPVIEDGHTVGRSAEERFPVQHATSRSLPRRRVYRVLGQAREQPDPEREQ